MDTNVGLFQDYEFESNKSSHSIKQKPEPTKSDFKVFLRSGFTYDDWKKDLEECLKFSVSDRFKKEYTEQRGFFNPARVFARIKALQELIAEKESVNI